MTQENLCCPKHFSWSVLGTPPLAKHENRCENLRLVSKPETDISAPYAADILDILCEPSPNQKISEYLKHAA